MLKRVSIQNFKSLKDVKLDLQKVNLLIGPNNSGKTNFLKALEIFQTTERFNNVNTEDIAFKKIRSSNIEIRLVSDYKDEDWDGYLMYENFSYRVNPLGNSQKTVWYQKENEPGVTINESNIDAAYFNKTIGYPKIYKPNPNKLDKPGPVGRGDESVAADVSNLIAFFDRIRDEYSSVFSQIKADLAKCLPEFTEINFQNVESIEELVKQFGDKTFKRIGLTDGRQNTIYWADELSEGTLYFIALLCIINQPNPPKLLLLEEPEKGIHPRRIFEVIQFIFRLAEEKDVQIIMTTHSPIVVDMFKDMPDSVFIFDKDEEGATHVKNLQRDVIEPETVKSNELGIEPPHYTDSLGDAWTVGFLGGVPK